MSMLLPMSGSEESPHGSVSGEGQDMMHSVDPFLYEFQIIFCTHPYRSIISASFSVRDHIAATILEDNCLRKVASH